MKLFSSILGRRLAKVRLVSCLLFVVTVMLSSSPLLAGDAEPEIRGHTLSYWLDHYSMRGNDSDRAIAEEAEIAIREIGTNALPALIVWLRYEPSQAKTNVLDFLARMRRTSYGRWIPASLTYDKGVPSANIGFYVLGAAAIEAIPELETIANDAAHPHPAARAMNALSMIGPAALPAIESRLANTNFPLPSEAAINMYIQTRTSANYHQLSAADARPILIELQTNANPLLVKGATQLLQVMALPSHHMRGETKSYLEALSDLQLERQMGFNLKPGWNIHPQDRLSREEQIAASNVVHSATAKPPTQQTGDGPYPYPLRPGTAAWNFAEVEERFKSCEIPKEWRDRATGWQLFLSAIAHPYFHTITSATSSKSDYRAAMADSYRATRKRSVTILSEVDAAPDFGTNVLRWLSSLDLAKMEASQCSESDGPCFLDYAIVYHMAGLDSALATLDVTSRQRLFRLAVWDADYFLSGVESSIVRDPIDLMYVIYNKPESFRGAFPQGLVLPPLETQRINSLRVGPQLSPMKDLRSALTTAKAKLGLTHRP